MPLSSPACSSRSRRIASRIFRRFNPSHRSRCRSRCSAFIAIFAIRDPKWLALFAGGWFLQGLCNGYYLLFFSVFVGMWILWFASPWSRPREFVAIGLAWLVAAVPMVPLLLHYRNVHAAFGFTRDFGTIRGFGADVAGLLFASHHLALWGSLDVFRRAEGELFPGLTIVLLVLAGVAFVRDPRAGPGGKLGNRAQDSRCPRAHHRARVVERRDDGSMEIRPVWDSPAVGDQSHQTAHALAGARARPRLDEPRVPTHVCRALRSRVLRACRVRDVAAQPWTGANPDGERGDVSRTLYAPDVSSRLQRAAGAGPILDDDDAVPGSGRRDHLRSSDDQIRSG